MKDRGFTLIELLAVIAILAIIALITVPIVTDAIDESRKSSVLRAAELYVHAVDNALGTKNLDGKYNLLEGWYNINSDGNLCVNTACTNVLEITAKNKPKSGRVYLKRNVVQKIAKVTYKDYLVSTGSDGKLRIVEPGGEPCVRQVDSDGYDTVTCGTETFYVMNENNNTVTMLTKYNLDVGYIFTPSNDDNSDDVVAGKANNNLHTIVATPTKAQRTTDMNLTPIENSTGIQKAEARGWISDDEPAYGVVSYDPNASSSIDPVVPSPGGIRVELPGLISRKYSVSPTATSSSSVGPSRPSYQYNYNSSSYLYQYVENYVRYLQNHEVSTATAKLLSSQELTRLGCSNGGCAQFAKNGAETFATAPSWVYSTSYWLGNGNGIGIQLALLSDGTVKNSKLGATLFGVRPVVTISKDEIKQVSVPQKTNVETKTIFRTSEDELHDGDTFNLNGSIPYSYDYNSLDSKLLLAHTLEDGVIKSTRVCFGEVGLWCLYSDNYEHNKIVTADFIGPDNCSESSDGYFCEYENENNSKYIKVYKTGSFEVNVGNQLICKYDVSTKASSCIFRETD